MDQQQKKWKRNMETILRPTGKKEKKTKKKKNEEEILKPIGCTNRTLIGCICHCHVIQEMRDDRSEPKKSEISIFV